MPRTPSSFVGPIAPWVEDEGDCVVFSHVKRRIAEALIRRLKARIDRIDVDSPDVDDLLHEMRRQTSAAGVDGDFTAATDLAELALELVLTAENAKRL